MSFLAVLAMTFASCAAPKYTALPDKVSCPVIQNTCSFGILNMDEQAKVENNNLVCHYKDFDVQYTISNDFIISLTIINNSNKDLLIDKTKCFVMYNGNANQLFKDARMTGSTTFNDVTGSTNVSTSHDRVMMIIPSYSKWSPTLNETNLRTSRVPDFMTIDGLHHLSVYDNPEVVEFSFEYSFDKKQAKWGYCRNKVYVNTVNVNHDNMMVKRNPNGNGTFTYSDPSYSKTRNIYKSNEYRILRRNGQPDFSEVSRINNTNQETFKRHNSAERAGHIITSIVLIPVLGTGLILIATGKAFVGCEKASHFPPR